MRMANQPIQTVRHLIPTVEDISLNLNQAKYFAKLDLSQAYHQLPLDEQSRFITTFSTHLGLFRYTRLPYGINEAAEFFQKFFSILYNNVTATWHRWSTKHCR